MRRGEVPGFVGLCWEGRRWSGVGMFDRVNAQG